MKLDLTGIADEPELTETCLDCEEIIQICSLNPAKLKKNSTNDLSPKNKIVEYFEKSVSSWSIENKTSKKLYKTRKESSNEPKHNFKSSNNKVMKIWSFLTISLFMNLPAKNI